MSWNTEAATADRWPQVAEIYLAAVDRAPAEREAFLREACAGDEALRREVESLLGYEGGADGLLERPVAAVAAPMLNTSASSSVLTGRQIGPYQIGALLGTGGMGEVYPFAFCLVPCPGVFISLLDSSRWCVVKK